MPIDYPPPFSTVQLEEGIDWYDAIYHRQQILILGKRDEQLFLARCDGFGAVAYYTIGVYTEGVRWLFAPDDTIDVLIHYPNFNSHTPPDALHLEENSVFSKPITVHFIHWLSKMTYGVGLCEDGSVAVVHSLDKPTDEKKPWSGNFNLRLDFFTITGKFLSNLEVVKKSYALMEKFSPSHHNHLVVKDKTLWLSVSHGWWIIDLTDGNSQVIEVMFNLSNVSISSALPDYFSVVARCTEYSNVIGFQRVQNKRGYSDNDSFGFPDIEPNRKNNQPHDLLTIGLTQHYFYAVYENRIDIYEDIYSDLEPHIINSLPFSDSAIQAFTFPITIGMCGVLTKNKQLLLYEIK